ncbi:uncharacterized, partial [Tachysurus ichikawai]
SCMLQARLVCVLSSSISPLSRQSFVSNGDQLEAPPSLVLPLPGNAAPYCGGNGGLNKK